MGYEASNWAATSEGVAVAFGEQNFQNGQNYRIPAWMQVGVFRTFWVPAVRRAWRHVLEYHFKNVVRVMKRIAILLPLLAGLAGPLAISHVAAAPVAAVSCEVSELPWSTVSEVLKKVEDVREYSYSQLVSWYNVGRVTVEQVGSGYRVTVLNDDGILEVLVIEGW